MENCLPRHNEPDCLSKLFGCLQKLIRCDDVFIIMGFESLFDYGLHFGHKETLIKKNHMQKLIVRVIPADYHHHPLLNMKACNFTMTCFTAECMSCWRLSLFGFVCSCLMQEELDDESYITDIIQRVFPNVFPVHKEEPFSLLFCCCDRCDCDMIKDTML